MRSLKWSTSHAVYVPEIDDEHKEIFAALAALQGALDNEAASPEIPKLIENLVECADGHFAHEERLMRAARYESFRWHKEQHDNARKRVGQFAARIERGDAKAGGELTGYLSSWLNFHTRLADKMLGAFLRNQRRAMWKVTFQAGTKPLEAGGWVDSRGNKFEPPVGKHSS